jgi:hypothetical protein
MEVALNMKPHPLMCLVGLNVNLFGYTILYDISHELVKECSKYVRVVYIQFPRVMYNMICS